MEEYLGREITGFQFKGGPGFPEGMKKYVGQIGKVKSVGGLYWNIKFSDKKEYSYPYPEILDHLVAEEEIDINKLFEQISKL